MKSSTLTALAVMGAALAAPGMACADAEIDRLRADFEQQLKALQQSYEARLQALEARLARSEAHETHQTHDAPQAQAQPAAPAPAPAPAAANAFNPEISLVLQGAFVGQKDIPDRRIGGFLPATTEQAARGFTLGNSELVFAANIDPTLRGQLNFSVGDGAVDVEEAWFQSLGLGHGLGFKGGRFVSGIGYANEQHPHVWDFADQSLMYRALFGEHLLQDGVQLKWLAPTETYLEFGAELGRGQFFPGSAAGGNRNGAGSWTAFTHSGGDVGDSHSWRAGVSYLAARPREREGSLPDVNGMAAATLLSGESNTWLADFVWKWAPLGNSRSENFKLQAELFRRDEDGTLACGDNAVAGGACRAGVAAADLYRARQSGGYVQGVYQFMPNWRAGYRYDRLNGGGAGAVRFGALPFAASDYRPTRHSLMADYSPSEFARFRLQLAEDKAMPGITDRQVTLQYIHSLGAHGAHNF